MESKNQYTAAAMRAIMLAMQKAGLDQSRGIGTEYLLLGLAAEPDGTAGVVLREYGINEEVLTKLVHELIDPNVQESAEGASPVLHEKKRGRRKASDTDPFSRMTPRANLALQTAGEQAVYFYSKDVGTEHILLALMRDVDSNAAKLLHTQQIDMQAMYTRILDIIGVSDEQLSEYLQMAAQSSSDASASPTPTLDQFISSYFYLFFWY